MKYQELIILLPCHSLEDFPVHHEGEEAEGLLANWTALWHPALINSAQAMPSWQRVDDPPEELADRLLLIPGVSQSEVQTGFSQRAKQEGATVIRRKTCRQEIIDLALAPLDSAPEIDPEFVADFLALGYCYLQIELLTRQMRYSSNLDEVHFQNQVVAAAAAAAAGEMGSARDVLANCFDILAEERDHYYSVDAFLLDLTMVADTTLGASLRSELKQAAPVNLLLTGELIQKLADQEPASLEAIRAGIGEGRVGLIAGAEQQGRWPLLSCESVLSELRAAKRHAETVLDRVPVVFGRRRFGLTPILPQVLHKLGYKGALHATFEDGSFAEGSQFKIRWEGCDGTAIDAVARVPHVATDAAAFLSLATKMGESMDMDHVATLMIGHWPGQVSPWYEDLRRIARYGNALGRFVTVEEYFRDTDLPGHLDPFPADTYRSPFLKQAVIRKHSNPISRIVSYWKARSQAEAAAHLQAMADLCTGKPSDHQPDFDAIDLAAEEGQMAGDQSAAVRQAGEQLAAAIPRSGSQPGTLVINSLPFTRRITVDDAELAGLPAVEQPIYAAHDADGKQQVVVDVPAMGFAWLSASGRKSRAKKEKSLVDEGVLRNEFFEALISEETGGLQALNSYGSRGNRLSQQIAYREPSKRQSDSSHRSQPPALYSRMLAESVETTVATPIVGEIATQGQLLHPEDDRLVGRFRQVYRAERGSRVLRISIEIEPLEELRSDPWSSYYACRFAWPSESAMLFRGVNQARQTAEAKRLESPLYLHIDDVKQQTTILAGGLPFHRRQGLRRIDSLLVVRGEETRRFELGIGVDLAYPMHQALDFITPPVVLRQQNGVPHPSPSSWLLHIDNKNVVATHWSPIFDDANSKLVGVRARLLETQNRSCECRLSCFREFSEARQVDFCGQTLNECRIEKGAAKLHIAGNEWVEVEASFA